MGYGGTDYLGGFYDEKLNSDPGNHKYVLGVMKKGGYKAALSWLDVAREHGWIGKSALQHIKEHADPEAAAQQYLAERGYWTAEVKKAKPPKPEVTYESTFALEPIGAPSWRKKDFERIIAMLMSIKPPKYAEHFEAYDAGRMQQWQNQVHSAQALCAANTALDKDGKPVFDPTAFGKAIA